ncbi:hypothetical protein [Pantoea sp. ME81]|nr:hypothetical protein [Pantoea sp. ME81]
MKYFKDKPILLWLWIAWMLFLMPDHWTTQQQEAFATYLHYLVLVFG